MGKAGTDIIAHAVQILAFGCMAQAFALRLDIIGFRFDNAIRKGQVIQRTMLTF